MQADAGDRWNRAPEFSESRLGLAPEAETNRADLTALLAAPFSSAAI
jgi:hypothetical protein